MIVLFQRYWVLKADRYFHEPFVSAPMLSNNAVARTRIKTWISVCGSWHFINKYRNSAYRNLSLKNRIFTKEGNH